MGAQFHRILIPADVSIFTKYTVEKAIELADNGATIDMLFDNLIPTSGFLPNLLLPRSKHEPFFVQKFAENCITHLSRNEKKLKCRVFYYNNGPQQTGIEAFARSNKADLIITARNARRRMFSSRGLVAWQLARNTGAHVFSVYSGETSGGTMKIIVPVSGGISREKAELLVSLSKKFRINILIAQLNENNAGPAIPDPHLNYQWLRSTIGCQVEHVSIKKFGHLEKIFRHDSPAKSTMLLVSDGYSRKKNLFARKVEDMASCCSGTGILTISSTAGSYV